MFASLEFWDFFWIVWIVLMFSGWVTTYSYARPTYARRLRRLEGKLDLILKHLNLEFHEPPPGADLSDEVKALADQPGKKIQAIKAYRQQTGASLREAKEAVEDYLTQHQP